LTRLIRVRKNLPLAGMCAAGIAGLLALSFFDPATSSIFPPCPVRYLSGWYCPGCGSLRAIHQLLHGNLRAALALNPLAVTMLPFLIYGLASYGLNKIWSRRLPGLFLPSVLIRAIGVAIFLFGIMRNLPFAPFAWLAPGAIPHP
jgi:hypothetical protein